MVVLACISMLCLSFLLVLVLVFYSLLFFLSAFYFTYNLTTVMTMNAELWPSGAMSVLLSASGGPVLTRGSLFVAKDGLSDL